MNDTVIISVGCGCWYPQGVVRLQASLDKVGYRGHVKIWANEFPPGSPTHHEIPYAFKAYALRWARRNGYRTAIWLDSSVWAQHNIDPIIDHIEDNGYIVFRNNPEWNTGQWATDSQLEAYGVTRDESFMIPHSNACSFGIRFDSDQGQQIYNEYLANTNLFYGSWTNEENQVSKDPRVLGSRHDQTVLSLIVWANGMELTDPNGLISSDITKTDSILLACGM